jgi:ABC-type polar amino acid transport system ATPase subunit
MGLTLWHRYYNKTQHKKKNKNPTKYHTTVKQKTAHKAIQTIKDTLHTINTTQKSKAIPVTGSGGL